MIMKLVFERCKDGKRIIHSLASVSVYKCSSLHLESILPAPPRNAKLSAPDWLRFVAAALLSGSSFFSVVFERQRVLWKDRS